MRLAAGLIAGVLAGATVPVRLIAQAYAPPPPPVTMPDCTKVKGKAKKDCLAEVAAAQQASAAAPKAEGNDPLAFPAADSKKNRVDTLSADMPKGDADPPASSMKPMNGADADPPGDSSSSSSSSSSGGEAAPAPADDDVAPTTAGSDTPVRPGLLKDLGSLGDSSAARQKLEQTRVEDDLKVGRYYYNDGDLAGATARYKDALAHDADNPDAHFGMAQVLVKQNKNSEAVAHLERYLQLAPDDDHTKDAQKMLAKLKR